MEDDVRYRPAYLSVIVTLDGNESIRVEGGAMVGMSAYIEMETEAIGGFLRSIGREMFGIYS
jgi:uncharacterized protein (AIM24 family)